MEVLDLEIGNQRTSRWDALNLQHACNIEELMSCRGGAILKLFHPRWSVLNREPLEVAQSVVQRNG
jgi:hypothetical protein